MKQTKESASSTKTRKAMSVEAREDQLISLAVNLAEQKLRDGTASPAIITHYLKLGSTKERLEKEMLAEQMKLVEAKTEALQTAKNIEALYADAISAMQAYNGKGRDNDDEFY